jgi:sec-independent protein translocase protein TatC
VNVMQADSMSLTDHLQELRLRIIWVVAVLAVTMVGGFFAAKPLLQYFKRTYPAADIHWNAFGPWDGLRIYMQFSFYISLLVTLPFILYHIWSFVKPGLRAAEQKATLRYIPYTVILFIMGFSFGYFVVFPSAFKFTSGLNASMDLTETYGISQYFSFMFNILLPLSLLFELPIIIMFLTRLRLLNPSILRKIRKYAYMILLIVATLVTPPDVVSVLIVAIPLILLYEISVFFSGSIYRKQRANEIA